MNARRVVAIVAVALLTPTVVAHAQQSDEIPAVIEEAFQPGSELFDEAVELLEYQGTLKKDQARVASSSRSTVVTYGDPVRTVYLDMDFTQSGPITDDDFYDMPDRYIAVQYVDGQVEGTYTVDVDGEFIEMGTAVDDQIKALENWPQGAVYATGGPAQVHVQISADGQTVRAITDNARELFGRDEVDAETFRAAIAAKQKELDEQEVLFEDQIGGSGLLSQEQLRVSPIALVAVGGLLAVAAAYMLGRGHRRTKARNDP
jgi:hypothetical protein